MFPMIKFMTVSICWYIDGAIFWNKQYYHLNDVYDTTKKSKALGQINSTMLGKVFPMIRSKYGKEMTAYFDERNKYNKNIEPIAIKGLTEAKTAFLPFEYDHEFHIMSSYKSKTNLIGESDIDIGLLIDGLDQSKLVKVEKILEGLGYVKGEQMNKENPDTTYYPYSKMIDGIEFEVKVRNNNEHTKMVLKLHEYLDNELTDDERAIITYGKYVLKKLSKKWLIKERAYKVFKTLVYEAYLHNIEGATLLRDSRV